MKVVVSLLAAASAAVSLSSSAHAEPPSTGIGLTHTLGGTRGLAVRYGRDVQLELVAGGIHLGDWRSIARDGLQRLSAAARVHVPLLRFDDGWIGAVAGVNLHRDIHGLDDGFDTDTWGVLEAGLHAEYFLVPSLSIGVDLGATRAVRLDRSGEGDDPTGADGIAPWSGAASLTYWLDASSSEPDRHDRRHVGIGLAQTLGGPRLTLSADLGRPRLEIYGGIGRHRLDGDTTTRATVGAGVLYEVTRRGRAALLLGARVAAVRVAGGGRADWSVEAELPVRLELDVASWLTLHAEGGLSVQTRSDDRTALARAELDGTGLTGALGFTIRY
jgi:hypothetical protein